MTMSRVTDTDIPVASGRADVLPVDWQDALRQHDRWLRAVVFARCGEAAAVEEVLQEISLAAVRQSAPLHEIEKLGAWLYRLAVRQALLYRRRLGRQRRLQNNFADRVRPSGEDSRHPDPLNWLLADERQRLVRVALTRLSGKDTEVLLLKYSENWSYQQIADHLGISHSAVEARLHRARLRLRSELSALEETEVTL